MRWSLLLIMSVVGGLDHEVLGDEKMSKLVKIDVAKNDETVSTETSSTVSLPAPTEPPTTLPITIASTITTTKVTTTQKPVATTLKPVVTSEATSTPKPTPKTEIVVKKSKTKRTETSLENYFCKCDLTIHSCDLNCCCDIDCSADSVAAFSCAEETFDANDYVMGNRLLPCKVQGGPFHQNLFCVARDRAGEAKAKTRFNEMLKKDIKYKWPDIFATQDTETTTIKEQYKLDDFILTYNDESKQAEIFELPTRLAQHFATCRLKQPIQFLRDFRSDCPVNIENVNEFNFNFIEKMSIVKFLKTPQYANIDSDDFVNVTVQICQSHLSAATCAPPNKTLSDWLSLTGHSIIVRMTHNFTQVTNATVFLIYDPDLDMDTTTIVQQFHVEFEQDSNQTNAYKISGNLGYLPNKPILVTKLLVDMNSTDSTKPRLEFFEQTNRTTLKIPVSRRNYCQLNEFEYDTINFGEDQFFRCNAPLLEKNMSSDCITPENNLTDVCRNFQKRLFHFLLNDFEQKVNKTDYSVFNLFVSEFGNPRNDTRQWRPFKRRNSWLDSIDQIKGTSNNDIALVCHNMMLNIKYDFYFARLTVNNAVSHQNLLKNAELEFGPLVNLQFRFDEEFKVPIFIQIQFHDLTSEACLVVGTRLLVLGSLINLTYFLVLTNV